MNYLRSLNTNYRFDNFENSAVVKLLQELVKVNFRTSANKILILGEVGVGKTHLAQAIANELIHKNSNCKVLYIRIETFCYDCEKAVLNNKMNELKQYILKHDYIILDDVHYLENKTQPQDLLVNIMNTCEAKRKTLIITSCQDLIDCENMNKRVKLFAKHSLIISLELPSFESKLIVLKRYISSENKEVSDEDIFKIASDSINMGEVYAKLLMLIVKNYYSDMD